GEGRVDASGLAAFDARIKSRYSFETRPATLAPSYLKRFRANRIAWRFFEAQPPWYRRTSVFWVMSAKRLETRQSRLAVLIAKSEAQEAIPPLKGPAASKARARAR
ncbi:MAG: YdeI family protein, partial [Vicinamibacteria bacterium]